MLGLAIGLILMLVATATYADSTPNRPAAAIVIERDVTYGHGGDVELKLDLARPGTGEGPFPAIVFIHGGGWTAGTREGHGGAIEAAARAGFVAVTITYRLAPAARFPAQVHDCKAAVRWVRANAAVYHIDPDHIGATGDSAGGHLAAMLGLTPGRAEFEGDGGNAGFSSAVQAVADYYGPSDLLADNWSDTVRTNCLIPFLGGKPAEKADTYRAASPINYVSKAAPPFLILQGDADKLVPPDQSTKLLAALKAAGVAAELVWYPGEGHGFLPDHQHDATAHTFAFFKKYLKP